MRNLNQHSIKMSLFMKVGLILLVCGVINIAYNIGKQDDLKINNNKIEILNKV